MPVPTGLFDRDNPPRLELDKGLRLFNGGHLEQRSPVIEDHFLYGAGAFNSHVPWYWNTTETGAATPWAPGAAAVGGLATCVTGATTNNSEEFAGKNVGWQPSTMGVVTRIWMEVRAKFVGATTPTDGDFVIGFANAVTFASGLPYVVSATSTLTTSAPVEFAGFVCSSIPTSGSLFTAGGNLIGVVTEKSSAATLASLVSSFVKDSNFHKYRVEIDSAGNAIFYLDDVYLGTVVSAVTAATALTPYVAAICKNSHALTGTMDWIKVGGDVV